MTKYIAKCVPVLIAVEDNEIFDTEEEAIEVEKMKKEEFMEIWEKVFDENKEDIESIARLTKKQANLVVDTLSLYIKAVRSEEET